VADVGNVIRPGVALLVVLAIGAITDSGQATVDPTAPGPPVEVVEVGAADRPMARILSAPVARSRSAGTETGAEARTETGPEARTTPGAPAGVLVEPVATWPSSLVDPAVAPARVATVLGDGVTVFDAPGDDTGRHWFSNPTPFGGDRVFLVVGEAEGWLEVSLPTRPNGGTGWVEAGAVVVSEVTTRAEVSLTERTLRVWDGAEVVAETPVVIGAAASPTPIGTFYVWDVIDRADPSGAYGPHILALSGFSEVLHSFQGAEPAIAIHGTNRPELLGQARSNGCVRIPNPVVELLAERVAPGTPVVIAA
jgi:lipoprotein-anchoring transpeptidase ErfK/SrfK